MFKKKNVFAFVTFVCAQNTFFYSGVVPHILQRRHLKIGADWLPLEA